MKGLWLDGVFLAEGRVNSSSTRSGWFYLTSTHPHTALPHHSQIIFIVDPAPSLFQPGATLGDVTEFSDI